jgi:hypothetical protein
MSGFKLHAHANVLRLSGNSVGSRSPRSRFGLVSRGHETRRGSGAADLTHVNEAELRGSAAPSRAWDRGKISFRGIRDKNLGRRLTPLPRFGRCDRRAQGGRLWTSVGFREIGGLMRRQRMRFAGWPQESVMIWLFFPDGSGQSSGARKSGSPPTPHRPPGRSWAPSKTWRRGCPSFG